MSRYIQTILLFTDPAEITNALVFSPFENCKLKTRNVCNGHINSIDSSCKNCVFAPNRKMVDRYTYATEKRIEARLILEKVI